jgi:hypothetical protein
LSDILTPSIKERLWHKLRADLARYVPEVANTPSLMCCLCGRFLPQHSFSLEHLVPQQTLKMDPFVVRTNPATPANLRSGNLLLCSEPLLYKKSPLYNNGCNSWKGRFFDRPISEIFSGRAMQTDRGRVTNAHIIGGLMLGYLAMVAEYGYIIALMESGLLLREQFFRPQKFHPKLGPRFQILLGGVPPTNPDDKIWTSPFGFKLEPGACIVSARNFAVTVPVSRDPLINIGRHLKITPHRHRFRPDFQSFFD